MGSVGLPIPPPARRRLEAAGIDLSHGYPAVPPPFTYQDHLENIRNKPREFVDAGTRADPEKMELFNAAKQIIHLTKNIGTEVVGLQLKDLNDKQKDELALLIAERGVVFFRDQDISPQQQKALGEYWGELYVCTHNIILAPQCCIKYLVLTTLLQPEGYYVPGIPEVSVIWPDFFAEAVRKPCRERPFQGWHT
jgi:hypothetical protein